MMNLNTRAFQFETTAREVTSLVRVRSKQLSLAYVVTKRQRSYSNLIQRPIVMQLAARLEVIRPAAPIVVKAALAASVVEAAEAVGQCNKPVINPVDNKSFMSYYVNNKAVLVSKDTYTTPKLISLISNVIITNK